MSRHKRIGDLTRRQMLRLSTTGAAALSASLVLPGLAAAVEPQKAPPSHHPATQDTLYAELLQSWCDGLIAHQSTNRDPALRGAFLCPACAIIHGRCGDAVYPLLRVAHTTGNAKYLEAALLVHEWSEQQVSRSDGSWINDVTLSSWKGITVFHSIALAEALRHHGSILDSATRRRWTDRLARAARFLDSFITIETGNINYPVTASQCFALCAEVLGDHHYLDRAHQLAHAALDYFTPNNLLFGEGHPQTAITQKKCRPVDLGYNVEESLPALAQYALLTNDQAVLDQTIAALRAHMEFMLPDGAWDNSWGSRNYKWSWWGSRTSDGCHPAYVLLAQHEPKFLEVAHRNLELMAACTHDNVLYGGPHYLEHGDRPCIHHTFTHAKALATVLDSNIPILEPSPRLSLPRDEPYVLRSLPEIATHLVSTGPWRATVTGYDFEYIERVQSGGGGRSGGGHASGGALSVLYHQQLGPILTASMTEYQMIEISNQQVHLDKPHMCLTPRIESAGKQTCTSVSDFDARISTKTAANDVTLEVRGRLLTASHEAPVTGDANYHILYNFTPSAVEIIASVEAVYDTPLQFILPVISRSGEAVTRLDAKTIRITKPKGTLMVHVEGSRGFDAIPEERTFNLVPGFECVPLTVTMQRGQEIRLRLEASLNQVI